MQCGGNRLEKGEQASKFNCCLLPIFINNNLNRAPLCNPPLPLWLKTLAILEAYGHHPLTTEVKEECHRGHRRYLM
jgi:hypothetical protein